MIYNITDKIGIALNVSYPQAAVVNDKECVAAAGRRLQHELGLFAHPIFSDIGGWPEEIDELLRDKSEGLPQQLLPTITDDEKLRLKGLLHSCYVFGSRLILLGSSDFFGLNYYHSYLVAPLVDNVIPDKYRKLITSCNKSFKLDKTTQIDRDTNSVEWANDDWERFVKEKNKTKM